jgi:SPP1 family predicted phage head-tail adaptor
MKIRGSGDRRHRVQILKRSITTANLESQPVYTPTETRWACIEPLSAREILIAQQSQVYAECTTKITMLYTPNLGHQDQLQFGNRIYEVVGEPINREEINAEMICMCCERK